MSIEDLVEKKQEPVASKNWHYLITLHLDGNGVSY